LTEQVSEVYSYSQELVDDENEILYCTNLFKALGDGNRQKILYLLRDGEKCVSDLLPYFEVLQPTVSTHLLILEEVGILKVRRRGRRRMYSISDPHLYEVLDGFVDEMKDYIDL
jgi:ArsR family transcriptional regulator